MTDDIFAEMEADAVDATVIPEDADLSGVAALAKKQLQLEKAVTDTEEVLKNLKKDLQHTQTREIPDALSELGLSSISLDTGESVVVKPFVSASITAKRKEEAHDWLRANGHGDIIKAITSVDTGRDVDAAERAREALAAAGLAPDTKESVHSGTLKAFVPIPLELFGAFLGQKSTITKG